MGIALARFSQVSLRRFPRIHALLLHRHPHLLPRQSLQQSQTHSFPGVLGLASLACPLLRHFLTRIARYLVYLQHSNIVLIHVNTVQVGLLPEKIAYAPSSARRLSRSDATLPPLHPIEGPPSPSTPVYPPSPSVKRDYSPSPSIKRDHSPSRLSPASLRGSFNHGPPEGSATSVPHPSSPNQSLRKPQTLSWPPFRPSRDDSSADFYPPFRAGPDSSEQPPPLSFRPTSGPGAIRGHTPLNTPARGRPTGVSNSNTIPIAPRHPFPLPSVPGRPSPPAAQPFHNSQPFGQSMSPKIPLKPSHAMVPDNGHPPRQPRSEVAPQAMGSPPLGPSMISKTYSQYPRHRAYFASCN